MDDKVRAEYESVLARVVIRHGTLVGTGNLYYGWIAEDWDHIHRNGGCSIVSHGRPVEAEWSEFGGTFDSDRNCHGIDLPDCTCACGKLAGRTMRYERSLSEVTEAVFTEMYATLRDRVAELESRMEPTRKPVESTVPENYMTDGPWRVANGS